MSKVQPYGVLNSTAAHAHLSSIIRVEQISLPVVSGLLGADDEVSLPLAQPRLPGQVVRRNHNVAHACQHPHVPQGIPGDPGGAAKKDNIALPRKSRC